MLAFGMDREEARNLGREDRPNNLLMLGPTGLLDPPRSEAIEAVKECHAGGIRVTMITGDHRITAAPIAKMPDIGDGKTAITGAEMQAMDTATLRERVRGVGMFARASPEHQLRLGQVATSHCCQGDLPDVISASLSRDAWAPITTVRRLLRAITSPAASAFPKRAIGRRTVRFRSSDFTAE